MSDIIPIKQAMSVGYDVYWNENSAWFRLVENGCARACGPFKTLEDAAYAALSDHEYMLAVRRERDAWERG